MKINRRYIILLGIVIFIAAFAFLYMNYSKQRSEAAQQNLTNANTNYNSAIKEKAGQADLLAQTNGQIAQLQSQLAQVQQQLQTEQQIIPKSIQNIDYDELLFNLAHDNSLVVLSINVNGPDETQFEDVTMFLTVINISVRGDTWNILSFVNDIATDTNFVSSTLDGVTMSVTTEDVQVDETTTIQVTSTQGDISLSLYGYEE
jgi:Tfp pilus assembly protein PilO